MNCEVHKTEAASDERVVILNKQRLALLATILGIVKNGTVGNLSGSLNTTPLFRHPNNPAHHPRRA